MPIKLPDLPFAPDALEPHISRKTFEYHHGKHHKAYVNKTNALIKGTDLDERPLELIVQAAYKQKDTALFNQAAQAWNHTFFWYSLSPRTGGVSGELAHDIDVHFNGVEAFLEKFVDKGVSHFGSGWLWLVRDGGELKIVTTANGDTPVVHGQTPLLTIDLWEHAYYLDFQNDRGAYLKAIVDSHINWEFAMGNYTADIDAHSR
ncbi:superoxide dismutase [Pseudokordiimonas caeni]|uniref:superoxide dismutase n=1 Tax=Pseudokordiimonas caeni TaxID=2997908 RepID=UPI00281281CC|nr:superoxide dismutase [Pseudokordiimonas caeni]